MLRKLAASYWTVIAVGGAVAAAHCWWLSWSAHAGEVLSGLGSALVVLGIWGAARPYIRLGLQPFINAGLPQFQGAFLLDENAVAEHRTRVAKAMPDVVRDVWAERVIAVAMIGLGTLLNGYGTPIARVLGMRI